MTRMRHDFLLGITVIMMAAIFLGTFFFLYAGWESPSRMIQIHFPHEAGMVPLKPGSAVMLANAIEVGKVETVGVAEVEDPQDPQGPVTMITVGARIENSVPLYGDCRIGSNQPAVGGTGYVNILAVGTPGVAFDPSKPIIGKPPASFGAAIGQLSERMLGDGGLVDQVELLLDPRREGSLTFKIGASLDDVKAITGQLRVQMSPDEQRTILAKFHRLLDDLNRTTGALREQMGAEDAGSMVAKLHTLLDQLDVGLGEAVAMLSATRPRIEETVGNLQATTATVRTELLPALVGEFDPQNPGALLGKVHTAMDAVTGTLNELQDVAATGRNLVVANGPAINSTLENVKVMSTELRRTSEELYLNPSRLIWGPEKWKQDKQSVFEAARNFAQAATALDDTAMRLEAIISAGKAGRGASVEDVRAVQAELQNAFQRFSRAEQYLYEKMK